MSSKDKKPWESHPEIWPTSTAFFTYLRGCLRKAWMKNPIKLEYIKKNRHQIDNPNPKGKKPTVWGFTCECCHKEFPIAEGQVDHLLQAGSLRSTEDIQGFVERLLYVTEDDIQLVCKGCHNIISYQQRHDITFEEARRRKMAIEFNKKPITEQKAYFEERGITIDKPTKAKLKEAYINYLISIDNEGGNAL